MCVLSHFSHVQFFVPPWTLRPPQAPLSLGFSRQEYRSGLPFPSPGDLPDKGIKPMSPEVPALQADFFTTEPWGKPLKTYNHLINQVLSSPPWGDVETKAYRRVTNCPRSTRENERVGIWIHIKIHHFNSMNSQKIFLFPQCICGTCKDTNIRIKKREPSLASQACPTVKQTVFWDDLFTKVETRLGGLDGWLCPGDFRHERKLN